MNVLDQYERNTTKVIESLSINSDDQLVPKKSSRVNETDTPITLYKERKSDSSPDYNVTVTWNKYTFGSSTSLKDILRSGSTNSATGTYIILIRYGAALYSGIMSYYEDTSSDIDDEIPLHVNGTFTRADLTESEGRMYAKIMKGTGDTYPELYLACSKAETDANTHVSIKFRKLL